MATAKSSSARSTRSKPARAGCQPAKCFRHSSLENSAAPPRTAALALVALASAVLFAITRKAVERVSTSEAEAPHMVRHDALTDVGDRICLPSDTQRFALPRNPAKIAPP